MSIETVEDIEIVETVESVETTESLATVESVGSQGQSMRILTPANGSTIVVTISFTTKYRDLLETNEFLGGSRNRLPLSTPSK